MTELLSCPFCGGDVSFHKDEECPGCHLIQCGQCRAFFDFATGADTGNDCESVDALRAAIAPMWNARANPTQQGEAVEVVAWVTPEKDRVITALTVAAAREDGGAMLSSVRPYSVPCMTVAQHERIMAAWQRTQSAGVPEARVTGAWDSARIGDFNAGWNACRDSAFTLMKKAAHMELDTTKRSIAIQDELRAMITAQPQASAAQSEPAGEREAVVVVAYLDAHDCLWNETTHPDRMIPLMTVGQHQRILAATVPAGCKVVPVEPTHAMVLSGEQQWELSSNKAPDCAAIYRAMLASTAHKHQEGEAEAMRAQRDKMAQILRDLVPGCKWRFMRPRIDQALQEVDGGN